MLRIHKVFAGLVIILFTAPNLYYVWKGTESFPFTSCPMFAHYIGDSTNFYTFRFIGEGEKGNVQLPLKFGNDNEMISLRFFFGKVYGSTDEESPFGQHFNDSPEQFEQRLSNFFAFYLKSFPKDSEVKVEELKTVRLEVWKYNELAISSEDKHVIGVYDVAKQRFNHLWKN